jgi:hypothetical protein
MVSRRRVADMRGKARFGCLFTLLLVAVVGYYGVQFGASQVRYWRMKDAMQSEARFAPNISDEVIRRRLTRTAQDLGLPPEAQRFRIRRFARPREIVITTSWQDTLALPFYSRPITRRPEARAQL